VFFLLGRPAMNMVELQDKRTLDFLTKKKKRKKRKEFEFLSYHLEERLFSCQKLFCAFHD
jgi:glycerol kinase